MSELSQFWDFLRFEINFERFWDSFQLGFSTCLYPCLISFFTRYWWSQCPSNFISHIISLISFRFGAAGNNYSIYHLLRCSIITGAGYWVQEFNKFRPTRRHSNKKNGSWRGIQYRIGPFSKFFRFTIKNYVEY